MKRLCDEGTGNQFFFFFFFKLDLFYEVLDKQVIAY